MIAAAAAGLVGASPGKANLSQGDASGLPLLHDPTIPERDRNGQAITRLYRRDHEGEWREIERTQIAAGDMVICIGWDGKRLWKCEALLTGSAYLPDAGKDQSGAGGCQFRDRSNLFDWKPDAPA